ncbi:amidohydrolase family protein [Haloarcula sediminis]|uniref:amidohydrolase family protein n=1 Tax=Haloarcula sediminis TaxID=3111777 RepID=UPI002D78BB3A|nr:amidohydrolase family protein [Haloarcula sp. CK38]
MTIDFGAHIYPPDVFPEPLTGSPIQATIGDALDSIETLEQRYEAAGIDEVVLSQPYYMGIDDPESTRRANDALFELFDEREGLYGLAALPVSAGGAAAAEEFERALDRGYNGAAIETKTNGVELVDTELEPVFDVAEQYGAPILVHPKLDESLHPDVLSDKYLLNATFGREAALAESISKVIHQGILDRHPDLNLVYHHLGGNIASMIGRIHLQLEEGRWPGQERTKDFEAFSQQLRERVYLDTSGFFGYETPVETALEVFPTSNLLFGTDYPFEPRSADELTSFRNTITEVASQEMQKILHDNAEELLVNYP